MSAEDRIRERRARLIRGRLFVSGIEHHLNTTYGPPYFRGFLTRADIEIEAAKQTQAVSEPPMVKVAAG